MKLTIEKEKVEEFVLEVDNLENLLTDRISDLSGVKGGMQARHAYVLYRKLLWEAKAIITDNLKPKAK